MKVFKGIALATVLLLLLMSCPACAKEAELTVTATIYPLYVALLNIAEGVPGVTLACMSPPTGGCLHDYQMTAADRKLLAESDMVVLGGAGLESFLDAFLPQVQATVLDSSEGVPLLGDTLSANPHVWVSVSGMRAQVRNIVNGLSAIDPAHAEVYARNGDAYCERLDALQMEMKAKLADVEGSPIVTFHEAFDYFAGEFGLRVVAVVENEPGSVPSARELAEVSDAIRREGVRALFAEPQYDDPSVTILSRETGVPVYLLDPAVSGDWRQADIHSYERIMRGNADTLLEALR